MKTKPITLLLTFVTVCYSFGQNEFTAKKMAAYQDKVMAEELTLSEKQVEKISEINLRYAIKQKALIDKEGSMFGKMGDMKKIGKAKNEELSKIFTKEQFEKYEDDVEPKIRKYMRKNIKF